MGDSSHDELYRSLGDRRLLHEGYIPEYKRRRVDSLVYTVRFQALQIVCRMHFKRWIIRRGIARDFGYLHTVRSS